VGNGGFWPQTGHFFVAVKAVKVAVLWVYGQIKNTAISHNYWVCSLRNGSFLVCLRVFLADFQYQGIQLVAELVHGSLEPYQKIKGNDYRKAYGADSR